MKNVACIILAAGEGKRMKSSKPKVSHEILGKPIINYVLQAAKGANVTDITVVIGHMGDVVRGIVDDDCHFAVQTEQLGTGHAVLCAQDYIPDSDVFVLSGDTPLITSETLMRLLESHRKDGNAVTLLSAFLDDPSGYGRMVRDSFGSFNKIVEHKDATDHELMIKEINAGCYCFKGDVLKKALKRLNNNNAQNEFYLTDTIEIIKTMGLGIEAVAIADASQIYGINTRSHLAKASAIMQQRIIEKLMDDGVTFVSPQNTYIGPQVTMGSDTVVYPGTVILGDSIIGANVTIGQNCHIENSSIGDGTTIESSYIIDSSVGENTSIGPFAYLRPHSNVGNHCKVGDFVEIKNSNIGNNTKIPHLSYIGDSDLGNHINVGCGCITVNYDGLKKHRTTIHDNAFIGCNSNMVAPVTVNKNAYIAAGSTITKEVPEGALAIGRVKQQHIDNFNKYRK